MLFPNFARAKLSACEVTVHPPLPVTSLRFFKLELSLGAPHAVVACGDFANGWASSICQC